MLKEVDITRREEKKGRKKEKKKGRGDKRSSLNFLLMQLI